jgi:hypothetical protein
MVVKCDELQIISKGKWDDRRKSANQMTTEDMGEDNGRNDAKRVTLGKANVALDRFSYCP